MKRLAEEAVENSRLISAQNIYADGLSISDTLREKADAFERHFEEYLPLARIYNEKLTDLADQNQALIRQFKKGLAIAESPEKSEEAEFCNHDYRGAISDGSYGLTTLLGTYRRYVDLYNEANENVKKSLSGELIQKSLCGKCKKRIGQVEDRCDNSIHCGTCSMREHRAHQVVDIGLEKLKKLEEQTAGAVEQQYDGVKGMVRLIHEQIDENVKRLAKEAIDNSKVISTQKVYSNGVTISDALRKNADDFEKHFEDYLPCARIYNEKLMELADENLTQKLVKSLRLRQSL
ncbi:unnamed protein product, partial [Mesorhabditis spiculigera]